MGDLWGKSGHVGRALTHLLEEGTGGDEIREEGGPDRAQNFGLYFQQDSMHLESLSNRV